MNLNCKPHHSGENSHSRRPVRTLTPTCPVDLRHCDILCLQVMPGKLPRREHGGVASSGRSRRLLTCPMPTRLFESIQPSGQGFSLRSAGLWVVLVSSCQSRQRGPGTWGSLRITLGLLKRWLARTLALWHSTSHASKPKSACFVSLQHVLFQLCSLVSRPLDNRRPFVPLGRFQVTEP